MQGDSTKYQHEVRWCLRRNGVLERHLKCTGTDVTSVRAHLQSLPELKIALKCRLFQVCACGYEGCNIRNPFADAVQIGLEVYRQHIAVTTSGMELMAGGSRRLPCNVRNDEMGIRIGICEGLVIVLLTETLSQTAVVGERRQ